MMQDNHNKKVLGAIEKLSGKFDKLSGKVETLSGKVGDVAEAVQSLATHMDKRFDAVDKQFEIAEKSVDKKIGKLRSDFIDHVTRQVGDAKDEIKKTIKTDREKHKLFDLKVLNIFERNKLANSEEIAVLKELVA